MTPRYCEMCDEWTAKRVCSKCGASTLKAIKPAKDSKKGGES